ncbi:MAG: hypothetical protein JEZ11_16345 [Desulfobacterales bacterium]|nr:hypothetical protein [Desulfobacterales bacterium]
MTRTATRIIGLCLSAALVLAVDSHSSDIDAVRTTVALWCRDWQARDLDRYMAHYHPRFQGNGLNREQWRRRKADLFKRSGPLVITVTDLWVVMDKDRAVARFLQRYQSQRLTETGEKTLVLVGDQNHWRIIEERWQPMPDGEIPDASSAPHPDSLPPADQENGPLLEAAGNHDGQLRLASATNSEKFFIALDHFFIPIVSTIDGDNPRIIIDIQGVPRWQEPATREVAGTWIHRIRSHLHRETPHRLRIVLDLKDAEALTLNQTYMTAENVYCLEIRKAESDASTASQPQGTSLIHEP